ncbi:hypothetical protein [uncultured Corynebacterium sp.]|uniref:hypothetical protein n=1 Tax=uncultured Corynebacterium sp. TaxID=159447 RepID=UPI0025EDC7EB|nr:hypothetical protein [uncultured Corynebacterium sp.]
MTWLLVLAVLIVLIVAGAVLPRRVKQEQLGFPWFWVAFPITVLAVALTVYSFLPIAPLGLEYGWTMYAPLSDPSDDYTDPLWPGKILWVVTAVAGTGLSVWTWRRGRV